MGGLKMIQKIVDKYMENKDITEKIFTEKHPASYEDVVKATIMAINNTDDYGLPDPNRIHSINDGDWQGTLVFIIAETGYQPSNYWAVSVYYGSCSGCDTLQAICGYDDNPPTAIQIKDYMSLALNIVQRLKEI